jgi:hypothetical protein
MEELEWLEGLNSASMLQFAGNRASSRQRRLFACALCRRIPKYLMRDRHCIAALETIERYADGSATVSEIGATTYMLDFLSQEVDLTEALSDLRQEAIEAVRRLCDVEHDGQQLHTDLFWGNQLWVMLGPVESDPVATRCRIVNEVLREIFGNPFRPVTFDPDWRTSTAVALAKQMYDTRDFSTMPILADALQEAGCDNADILDHCRGNGPHVRGCWVVDMVLGKS